MRYRSKEAGITLIEVVIGISIITIAAVAIGYSINSYVSARAALLSDLKAAYLAEEGYELIRSIRDDDWMVIDALSLGTLHYLDVSSTTATVSATPEVIDGAYTRSFELEALYRNASDDVTTSGAPGATVDDGGRMLNVHVNGPNGTTTFEAIITNIHAAS